jgi:RNA polymerase sigma factor (sigma-70 family)
MLDPESPPSPNPSLTTQYSLLEQIRDPNNQDAWKKFIAYYEHYIYNILRRMGLSPSEANEVRQEIIVKLWKYLPDFTYEKDRGKFRLWLGTVIKNDARRFYRTQKRNKNYVDSQQQEKEDHPEGDFNSSDLDRIISDEWDSYISNLAWDIVKPRFKKKTQDVFLLFAEGKDRKEIAETLDLSESSIDVYIKRVRDHLKVEFERLNQELL